MRYALCGLLALCVSGAACASSLHYVDFINTGQDWVVSIEIAIPDGNDWTPIHLRGGVAGSYTSFQGGYMGEAMASIHTDRGCIYDFRIEFAKQEAILVQGFDVCHMRSLDIERTWLKASMASKR